MLLMALLRSNKDASVAKYPHHEAHRKKDYCGPLRVSARERKAHPEGPLSFLTKPTHPANSLQRQRTHHT